MLLQLVVARGPDLGTVFELEQHGSYLIGRDDDCSIQLSDARISRHHCQISVSGGKALLQDKGSSWGTIVNGVKVDQHPLQPGDVVVVAETELRFEVTNSAAATTWQPDRPAPQLHPEKPKQQPKPQNDPQRVPTARPVPAASPKPRAPLRPPKVRDVPAASKEFADILESSLGPAKKSPSTAAALTGQGDLSQLVGTMLDRYAILDVISKTRTGILFRARDTRHDRQVALKVLLPELTLDDADMQRFVRAAKTVVGVRHPNIVRLHAAGKSKPRYCWTVSELLEGDSLMDVMVMAGSNGKLPWQQCLRIAIHIARAIEGAAAKGFVHRNITPTNILIRKIDGVAKLGDLMLVKALEGTQAARVTRPGETVGDIPYLSPEQLLSESAVDFRSDIYSLGATVYAAITGRPPFERKSLGETISRIEKQKPARLSSAGLDVPEEFETVLFRMLEKDPDDRFVKPKELVKALEDAAKQLDQDPLPLPEGSQSFPDDQVTLQSIYDWVCELPWAVRKRIIIGAIVVVVAIIMGSMLSSALSGRSSSPSGGHISSPISFSC
jgi:serine/threonine protein kinase/pSer/pThr/pTyr-binding forkhead associated (FHA) protein